MVAQSATSDFDAAALTARQAALRLFVEDIADHVMARQLPQSYLEAERAVRAVSVSDRFLQAVPAEVEAEAAEEAPSGATSRATSPADAVQPGDIGDSCSETWVTLFAWISEGAGHALERGVYHGSSA